MCKFSNLPALNQDNSEKFILPCVNNLTLEANTSSMSLSSFGGLPILQNADRHLSLSKQLSSCITDNRKQHLVQHTLEEIIMMRIFQICLGYEDVNDCDRTRKDPMMQLAVSQGGLDKELCSLSPEGSLAQYRHYCTR